MIQLPAAATLREVQMRFQGGFAGKECAIMAGNFDSELQEIGQFYPKDGNSMQISFLQRDVHLGATAGGCFGLVWPFQSKTM